ncbi:13564_t:CDS:2 [Cetraspora pellucida]|uniref:13564_t:CDS:1 n=1 Tax=Cetraspora pellucida TaxID=1433469 RepID=A0A9N9FXN8_9GLOM|nr:13564_t:CDS:2 [Cetraspora pellucida]
MTKFWNNTLHSLLKTKSEDNMSKNQLLLQIEQLKASLEEQKRENAFLKESHANEIYEREREEMERIYKHEREVRERTHKREVELMQQNINILEQKINDLQA